MAGTLSVWPQHSPPARPNVFVYYYVQWVTLELMSLVDVANGKLFYVVVVFLLASSTGHFRFILSLVHIKPEDKVGVDVTYLK